MAHGFLTPKPAAEDKYLKYFEWLYRKADEKYGITDKLKGGLKDLLSKFGKKSGLVAVDKGPVFSYEKNETNGVNVRDVTGKPAAKMLKGAAAGLLKAGSSSIAKSEKPALPPGGPRLSGSNASPKGGGFVNVSGASATPTPLNADTFFKRATTGTGAGGEYLSVEERKSLFAQSRAMRSEQTNAPTISADSGVDIVAAVNQVTSAILNLQSIQEQTGTASIAALGRLKSALEEQQMELGGDYSGFLTPENFQKREKKKQEQKDKKKEEREKECGCPITPFVKPPALPPAPAPIYGGPPGGGEGGFEIPLPISDPFEQWRSMPNNRGLERGARRIFSRGAGRAGRRGAIAIGGREAAKSMAKPAQKATAKGIEKGLTKGAAKLGAKALGKIPGVSLLTGAGFAIGRLLKGDLLGAAGELGSGIASTVPGVGTGVALGIDAALAAKDMAMPETALARGGIVTQPTTALIGENPLNPFSKQGKAEGVFPLEGKEGKATFTNFGEGVLEAQKENKDEFAKIEARGMSEFFDRQKGFDRLVEKMKAAGIGQGGGGGDDENDDDGANEGDMSGSTGQEQAMNYFMSQGMTKDQAAGIVGNLMQESGPGLDPMANNGTHRGIAQWDKNRWGNFEKWAKKQGLDVNTREAQLQWIMEEMKTGDGGLGIERFKKTKTATEAASLFLSDYERSGEKAGSRGYENRMTNARSLAKRDYSGGGGMEMSDPEGGGEAGTDIQRVSHPDTGAGWTIPGAKDASGRPPVFSKGGAAAFARMMKDSKGQVKPSDIASSKRSPAKNVAVGGVPGSNHLGGNALDIHGSSQAWMRRHGKKYGWVVNDYPGSHGGHFDFRGSGGGSSGGGTTVASSRGSGGSGSAAPRASSPSRSTPRLSPSQPNTGTELYGASAQYSAMGLTAGGGSTNNIFNMSASGNGQSSLGPNALPVGPSASGVGPGWFYQVAAARL